MARLIWTEPAINDLESIAEYVALDKREAAQQFIRRVFDAVERLKRFPNSGSVPAEIPHLPYRQIILPPCRIFYRIQKDEVFIIFVMREERTFDPDIIAERD